MIQANLFRQPSRIFISLFLIATILFAGASTAPALAAPAAQSDRSIITVIVDVSLDTWINGSSGASTPDPFDQFFFVGADASENESYSLMKFDTSVIPAGATIFSAELLVNQETLLSSTPLPHDICVKRVTSNWDASVTAATAPTRESTCGAPTAVDNNFGPYAWSGLESLVQDWLDTPADDHGLSMTQSVYSDGVKAFQSADGNVPPMMIVIYEEGTAPEPEPAMRFEQPKYTPGECAKLNLHEPALNNNPQVVDSAEITLYSRLTGDVQPVTLTETGANSAQFSGACIDIVENPTPIIENNKLEVEPGDLIFSLASDANGTPLQLGSATVAGGTSNGAFTPQVDTNILPVELQFTEGPYPGAPDFPLAMVMGPNQLPTLFGADQVILVTNDEFQLNDFLARRNGELLNTLTLPSPTLDDQNFHLIRIDPMGHDASDLAYQMGSYRGAQGVYTYSSTAGRNIISIVLEEQLAGNMVLPNALMQGQADPVSNEGATGSAFNNLWMNPDTGPRNRVGMGEALSLLNVLDWRENGRQVPVAIIDGGFAGPSDFSPAMLSPDYGVANFNDIPQCSFNAAGVSDCSPGSAAGPNPITCSGTVPCDWHGMGMFSHAAAEFDNGFGSVGTGAHSAEPMFMKVGLPYILPAAAAIVQSTNMGAEVINLSSGFPCKALLIDVCEPFQNALVSGLLFFGLCPLIQATVPPLAALSCSAIMTLLTIPPMASAMERAVEFAESEDVLITASAGNDVTFLGIPFDARSPQQTGLIPCILGNVLCVSELDASATDVIWDRGTASGVGVDIYAPNIAQTPNPNSSGGTTTNGGSSGASAFMAGVAVTVRSIDSSLTNDEVQTLILNAGCSATSSSRLPGIGDCIPSSDATVNFAPGGFVDFFEAVRVALDGVERLNEKLATCTGGWDNDNNDSAVGARLIPFTPPASGGTFVAELTGDLSVHSLGDGSDWYRLDIPTGTGGYELRITLDSAGEGVLVMQAHADTDGDPASGVIAFGSPIPAGTPMLIPATLGTQYYIEVARATTADSDDDCYGGSTLTFEVIRTPDSDGIGDSYVNATTFGTWEHTNWLCSDEIRRELADPDLRCPDIFADGISDRGAVDVWRMTIDPLSLHTVGDKDFFNIELPDISDSSWGDLHADIDPSTTAVEPLFECGTTTRSGLIGSENINLAGRLIINVRPRLNSLSVQPIPAVGETINLYDGSGSIDNSFGRIPAPTYSQEIECPQSVHGLSEITFSFGERSPLRSLFESGGYELQVIYQIEADRNPPDFVPGDPATRLPCFGSFANPFGGLGIGGVGMPSFPLCPNDLFDQSIVEFDNFRDCIADGPGCMEYFLIAPRAQGWTASLEFEGAPGMKFILLDDVGEQIGEAFPFQRSTEIQVMDVDIDKDRYHVLLVDATGSADNDFTLRYTSPQPAAPTAIVLTQSATGQISSLFTVMAVVLVTFATAKMLVRKQG